MSELLAELEALLIKYFLWIIPIIIVIYLWTHNLIYGLFTQILIPLLGIYILGKITWKIWIHYIQQDFISGIDFVLLEIIPPREVLRSPKAMELFITNALYHQSGKGGREEFWQGAVHFWFSLEIASIDGQVHFYVRVPSRVKTLVETQMYAQYPQSQVKVVEDYTLAVDEISKHSKWMAWGCEFKLKKPSAYPIKTYIDFGLDKDPKEEMKVDPISPLIEFFGSLQKGEQAWMQVVITPSHIYSTFKKYDWVLEAQEEMRKMLALYSSHKDAKEYKDIGIGRSRIEIRVPPFYDRAMKSMNAKTSKLGFDTGIRVMYVAKKEVYAVNRRKDIRLIFRQYAAPDVNEFTRYNSTQGDALGSGIMGLSQDQVMKLADRMLHEYQERGGFFYHPLRHQLFNEHKFPWLVKMVIKPFFLPYLHSGTFVLNTEELATIWHFPGQILKVPTLTRIESKEASPPPNLPI
jgi:hypothetical protein